MNALAQPTRSKLSAFQDAPGMPGYPPEIAGLRIAFSGTRYGMSPAQFEMVKDTLTGLAPVTELHHGDCQGADIQADLIAHSLHIDVIVHPPDNPRLRAWCIGAAQYRPPLDYLARDRAMVDEADLLIAAPKAPVDELHSGTWATINYARKVGRPIIMVYRSGYVERFPKGIPAGAVEGQCAA